jgi:hypothetical protein
MIARSQSNQNHVLASQAVIIENLTAKTKALEEDIQRSEAVHQEVLGKKDQAIQELTIKMRKLENLVRSANDRQALMNEDPCHVHSGIRAVSGVTKVEYSPEQCIQMIIDDLCVRAQAEAAALFVLSQSTREVTLAYQSDVHGTGAPLRKVVSPLGEGILGSIFACMVAEQGQNLVAPGSFRHLRKNIKVAQDDPAFLEAVDFSACRSTTLQEEDKPMLVYPLSVPRPAGGNSLCCLALVNRQVHGDEKPEFTNMEEDLVEAWSTIIAQQMYRQEYLDALLTQNHHAHTALMLAKKSPLLLQRTVNSVAACITETAVRSLGCAFTTFFRKHRDQPVFFPCGISVSKAEIEDLVLLCLADRVDQNTIERTRRYADHLETISCGLLSPLFDEIRSEHQGWNEAAMRTVGNVYRNNADASARACASLQKEPNVCLFFQALAKYTSTHGSVRVDVSDPDKWRAFLGGLNAGTHVPRTAARNVRQVFSIVGTTVRSAQGEVSGVLLGINKTGCVRFSGGDFESLRNIAEASNTAIGIAHSIEGAEERIAKEIAIVYDIQRMHETLENGLQFDTIALELNHLLHDGLGGVEYTEIVAVASVVPWSACGSHTGKTFATSIDVAPVWLSERGSIVQHVARTKKVYVVTIEEMARGKEHWVVAPIEEKTGTKVYTLLCVPILNPASLKTLAVLVCVNKFSTTLDGNRQRHSFDSMDQRFVSSLACAASPIYEKSVESGAYVHTVQKASFTGFSREGKKQTVFLRANFDRISRPRAKPNAKTLSKSKVLSVFLLCARFLGKLTRVLRRYQRAIVEAGSAENDAAENQALTPNPWALILSRKQVCSWEYSELEIDNDDLEENAVTIFRSYGFINAFHVPLARLKRFISQVRFSYQDNPFHSFKHGMYTLRVVYHLLLDARKTKPVALTPSEELVLAVSALAVGVSHPGRSNQYEVNNGSLLAIRFNDVSVYENLHASIVFQILQDTRADIMGTMAATERRQVRKSIINTILFSDLSRHEALLCRLEQVGCIHNGVDLAPHHAENNQLMCEALIHLASNTSMYAMPTVVMIGWTNQIIEEFRRYDHKDALIDVGLSIPCISDGNDAAKYHVHYLEKYVEPAWGIFARVFSPAQSLLLNVTTNRSYFHNKFTKD